MTDLASMTKDQLLALVASMKQEQASKITMKVGEKGTLCVYHGSRYPIALYASQWEALLPFFASGKVEAFIAANRATLARRDA